MAALVESCLWVSHSLSGASRDWFCQHLASLFIQSETVGGSQLGRLCEGFTCPSESVPSNTTFGGGVQSVCPLLQKEGEEESRCCLHTGFATSALQTLRRTP